MTSFEPDIYLRSKTPGQSFKSGNRKFTATPPFPSAIQTVVVTPGDGQITVTWTAPATGVVSGYRVGRSANPDGSGAWDSSRPAGTTSQTFLSLTNGHEYEIYIEPFNDYGETRTTVQSTPVAGPGTGTWESNSIAPSFLRPYATTSIWKRKTDPAASRVTAGTAGFRSVDGYSGAGGMENVHFFDLPGEGSAQTVARYGRASSFADKCANRGAFVANIQMPTGWNTRNGLSSTGKNNQINVLNTNGSDMRYYQATMACSASELVAGDPVYSTGTLGGAGLQGSRGASRVANGGCIRPSDLTEPAILHPLELIADQKYLYGTKEGGVNEPGFRWPATSRDGSYNVPGSTNYYEGSVPEMKMGSLVSISVAYDFDANGITNAFIRKIGECLKVYGAYVVDVTGWANNSAWSLGCDSLSSGTVETGLGFTANKSQWFKLIEALQVVDTTDHPENPN